MVDTEQKNFLLVKVPVSHTAWPPSTTVYYWYLHMPYGQYPPSALNISSLLVLCISHHRCSIKPALTAAVRDGHITFCFFSSHLFPLAHLIFFFYFPIVVQVNGIQLQIIQMIYTTLIGMVWEENKISWNGFYLKVFGKEWHDQFRQIYQWAALSASSPFESDTRNFIDKWTLSTLKRW